VLAAAGCSRQLLSHGACCCKAYQKPRQQWLGLRCLPWCPA
jgi:hypothetical protein